MLRTNNIAITLVGFAATLVLVPILMCVIVAIRAVRGEGLGLKGLWDALDDLSHARLF